MKLQIKRVSTEIMPAGKAFVLADEAGNMLPNQQSIILTQDVSSGQTVTVTFFIDGENIRIEEACRS